MRRRSLRRLDTRSPHPIQHRDYRRCQLAFTLVALATVDRYGRRFLLISGVTGLTIIYTILGAFYRLHVQGLPMLVLVLAAWLATPCHWRRWCGGDCGDLSHRIRGGAMSIAVTALWIACFVLTYTFPSMNAALVHRACFGLMRNLFGRLAVSLFLLAETKGKSLEELRPACEKASLRRRKMYARDFRFARVAALFCLVLSVGAGATYGQQTNVVLDGNGKGRVFDGLGAASAGASSRLLMTIRNRNAARFSITFSGRLWCGTATFEGGNRRGCELDRRLGAQPHALSVGS